KVLAEKAGWLNSWRAWRERLAGPEAAAHLWEVADELRIKEGRNATILLAIDQLEEIFTAAEATEREQFLHIYGACAGPQRNLPYLAIATIRYDILTSLLESNQLTVEFEDFLLAPLSLAQIPKIVEGPATVAALALEKGLPHRVAEDVKSADA